MATGGQWSPRTRSLPERPRMVYFNLLSLERPPSWNTWQEFFEDFWKGYRGYFGNVLIEGLNEYAYKMPHIEDCIRRETFSPTIYVIGIEDPMQQFGNEWQFCKVGFTHVNRKDEINTHTMENIQGEIQQWHEGSSVLLRLPVSATDTRLINAIKKQVMMDIGFLVDKDLALEQNLPTETNVAFTTKAYIKHIQEEARKMEYQNKLSTKLFTKENTFRECYNLPRCDVRLDHLPDLPDFPEVIDMVHGVICSNSLYKLPLSLSNLNINKE